ncbi:MAG: hypothetical protein JWM44_818 [Bacilli bacterium]|nr:hypothetical protein [Bacilli bacterium]
MRKRILSFLISTAVLFGIIFLLQISLLSSSAFAAVDTASDLTTLESKLSIAMHTKPASYSITYTGGTVTQAQLDTAFNNIWNADDYLHYSTKTFAYNTLGSVGNISINYTFTYWENAAQEADVSTKVTNILASIITGGMNDFAKEKAIHDYIVSHVAYDTSLAQHSAYAALNAPYRTVCQGYALLAYKMLNQAGIPTKILEGKGHGIDHTWVQVQIGGAIYHLDPTWDDPVPDVAGRITYDYYNLTDAQIATVHTWTKTYPVANTAFDQTLTTQETADAANLALYQTLENNLGLQYLLPANTASNQAEITAILQTAINANAPSATFRFTTKSTAVTTLTAALKTFTNIQSASYSQSDFLRSASTTDELVSVVLNYNTPIAATTVTISPGALSIKVGGTTEKLTTVFTPVNASNKSVTWATYDSTIATVSTLGVVKAVGPGTTTITATAADGSNKVGTANVIVTMPVSGVSLNKTVLTVKQGFSDTTLIAHVLPSTATVTGITYKSSNNNVATVSVTGEVYGIGPGNATITATSTDGSKVKSVSVKVPVPVTGVILNKTTATVAIDKTVSLIPTIQPKNAGIRTYRFKSSDYFTASVNGATGLVTANHSGTATITVTSTDGSFTAECIITVP